MPERLQDTLRRLKEEKDEADRRYNDALTALDRSLIAEPDLPSLPASFDAHQIAALNDAWNIIPGPPPASGFRQRLANYVWGVVGPYFQRQLTFNSWLVDHLNRNLAAGREAHRAHEEATAILRRRFAALSEFQTRLIQYLQEITAYVDTRDREAGGSTLVLNAAISGVAESLDKRSESMAAREQRMEQRTTALAASLASTDEEFRAMIAVSHQAVLTLKREVERLLTSSIPSLPQATGGASHAEPLPAFAPALDSYKYVGFEDRFRGSRDTIGARFETYVPTFARTSKVLDVGCGRGEFLELLNAAGIQARGIDLNHEMVELCRARGLDVSEADAIGYLASLPDGSLGGLFSAQVVEHLEPATLLKLLDLAFQKLRPGAPMVLETLNPACWVAFFESYIRDITHIRPLHPDTLKYLVLASGFERADVEFKSPVPPQDRLQIVPIPREADNRLTDLLDAFNANVERLNARLFTYLDYAIVARR